MYLPMQEMQKAWVRSLGQGDSLEKGMATHSSILPCKIPWTKEPHIRDSLVIQWVKDPPAMQETQETCRFDPWVKEDPLEEGMVTYSSILAWKIPWTEEPAGLQSKGSERVRHNWVTKHIHQRAASVQHDHISQPGNSCPGQMSSEWETSIT